MHDHAMIMQKFILFEIYRFSVPRIVNTEQLQHHAAFQMYDIKMF